MALTHRENENLFFLRSPFASDRGESQFSANQLGSPGICIRITLKQGETGTGGKPSTWFPPGILVELPPVIISYNKFSSEINRNTTKNTPKRMPNIKEFILENFNF